MNTDEIRTLSAQCSPEAGIRMCEAADEIERLTELWREANGQAVRALSDYERLERHNLKLDEEIDRLRAVLQSISELKAEDMYRADDDNTAAFIARTALEQKP